MASQAELVLQRLILKLDRRIARAERQLRKDRDERDGAYSVYAKLASDPSVAELKVIPKAPTPHLHQAILIAAHGAAETGVQFAGLVAFVEATGIKTTPKSIRATAHRLVAEKRLKRGLEAATYVITAEGAAKLGTLQSANPVDSPVVPSAPKKDRHRTYRPKLSRR